MIVVNEPPAPPSVWRVYPVIEQPPSSKGCLHPMVTAVELVEYTKTLLKERGFSHAALEAVGD
jgi:hypothetical protein